MTTVLPTEDADLVVLARRGGVDAFAVLYERYFAEIFDFLTRLLRDRDEAADVAQDTFVKAFERLGHIKNPASFKSWLFTIAHRNALNRIKRSKRAVAVGGFTDVETEERTTLAVITVDLTDDPEHVVEVKEAATIVWEAAAGLDERTYTVMDLHVRHGLDSAEIAEVLGVTKGNAYTMVSRMKKSVSDTMATYLLVRKGRRECRDLAAIVDDHGGPELTPELRRAVDKHARECAVCHENRRTLFVPLKLFAALAAVPVPAGLHASVWASATATATAATAGAAAAGVAATAGTNGAGTAGGATGIGSGSAATAGGVGAAAATAGTGAAAGAGAATVAATAAAAGAGAHGIAGIAAGILLLVAAAAGGIAVVTSDDVPAGPATINQATTQAPGTTVAGQDSPVAGVDPSGSGNTTGSTVVGQPGVEGDPAVPIPPLVIRDDVVVIAEDTPVTIDILGNDEGIDVAGTSVEIAGAPLNGTAVMSGTSVTYDPNTDFNGADTFSYSVLRPGTDAATATVRVAVTPVNDAPRVSGTTSFSVVEDSVLRFDPLASVTDPDGDPVTISGYERVTTNGGVVAPGVTAYVPAADFFGTDAFSYQVSDGTETATIQISVTVEGRNDAPRHDVLSVSATEDVDVSFDGLAGWYDIEGDAVAMAKTGDVATDHGGRASIDTSGRITYDPPLNFNGTDSFVYEVTDGDAVAQGTMEIEIAAVNDAPTVDDLRLAVDEGLEQGTTLRTLAGSDVDGDALAYVVDGGDTRWLTIGGDGTVVTAATLDHEAAADLEIHGRVVDPGGLSDDFTVVVEVADIAEAPHLVDQSFTIDAGAAPNTVVGTIAASDDDAGDSLTFTLLDDANEVLKIDSDTGVVTLARRGLGRFFPLTTRIRATDSTGLATTASLTITALDVDGPHLSRPLVDNYVVYEALAPGQACPLGPNRARVGVRATDASGIDSIVLDWEAVFGGSRVSGVTAMAFDDPFATGSFTFEAGLVPEGESSTLTATVVATDGAGNRSSSAPIVITVMSCDVGG
jgi:RNA polymerase sigma factor (sigma-70 family)